MSKFLPRLFFVCSAMVLVSSASAENTADIADAAGDTGTGVLLPKDTQAQSAMVLGEKPAVSSSNDPSEAGDGEEIWVEISHAIEGLNEVVGDRMFLDLRRRNESEMEVRVDVGFWQRVRYQTRVDLKNDISNIWHLYVKQYYDGTFSSVHFVDDSTDKTIDIFTHAR